MPVAAALAAAVAVAPSIAAGSSAPSSASFTAYDYGWSANGNAKITRLTIARGGTVTFSYPTGRSEHNADFGIGPHPTSCTQTAGPSSGRLPPLPHVPTGDGWGGSCTFDAPGVYTFHCDLHPFMTGRVVVVGSGGSPFAGRTAIRSPQRGAAVSGSIRLSDAATGGALEIDLRAGAKSLGRRESGVVRVGRLTRSELRPGTVRFTVALDASVRRAERRHGRLAVTVAVTVRPPGRRPVSLIRRVTLLRAT